jgi:hypothetical protein
MIISSHIHLRVRNISHSKTKAVDKIKSHILCSIIISPKIIVYEIMWKNIVGPDMLEMTI